MKKIIAGITAVTLSFGICAAMPAGDTKAPVTALSVYAAEKLPAPSGFDVSKTENSITVTWDEISGAEGYIVYRYSEKTGDYEEYKKVRNAKVRVSYLRSGEIYKFKISAVQNSDGKRIEGKKSKILSVKTKGKKTILTDDMKKAYLNALDKDFEEAPFGLYIGDINADGYDEMVAAFSPYGYDYLYYFNEKGMQELELEVMSDKGYTSFKNGEKKIYNMYYYSDNYGSLNDTECYVYEWDGSDYKKVSELKREGGYYRDDINKAFYGEATVDGKKFSNKVFDKKLAEFNAAAKKSDVKFTIFYDEIKWDLDEEKYNEYIESFLM